MDPHLAPMAANREMDNYQGLYMMNVYMEAMYPRLQLWLSSNGNRQRITRGSCCHLAEQHHSMLHQLVVAQAQISQQLWDHLTQVVRQTILRW